MDRREFLEKLKYISMAGVTGVALASMVPEREENMITGEEYFEKNFQKGCHGIMHQINNRNKFSPSNMISYDDWLKSIKIRRFGR
ncbi:hypothetical protein [Galbibacter sp. BG1]